MVRRNGITHGGYKTGEVLDPYPDARVSVERG